MRSADAEIPAGEELYRWLGVEDATGSSVLPHAVDLQGTSVDRSRYRPDPLKTPPPNTGRNGIASTRADRWPTDIKLNDVPWEFFAVDWPEPFNEAHAEIRFGRCPQRDRPVGFKPKSPAAKQELRARLAGAMTVIRAPT